MSQNIEIEFKNLLSKEEFTNLIHHFKINPPMFQKQVNHYFDTPSFSLKACSSALRIREKGDKFELTLKQPARQGLLETNQNLTPQEAGEMLKTGKLLDGEVKDAVSALIDDAPLLENFGSLTTERAEFPYKGGLLVLDHSYYLNTEDYEIEYEVTDEANGFIIFTDFLAQLNIPVRETDNKIKRFYSKKAETF
jgi:uncharacterized protein YjbK